MNVLGMLGIALTLWGILAVLGLSSAWRCILVGAYLCVTLSVMQHLERRRRTEAQKRITQTQRAFADKQYAHVHRAFAEWVTRYLLSHPVATRAPKPEASQTPPSPEPNERGH